MTTMKRFANKHEFEVFYNAICLKKLEEYKNQHPEYDCFDLLGNFDIVDEWDATAEEIRTAVINAGYDPDLSYINCNLYE